MLKNTLSNINLTKLVKWYVILHLSDAFWNKKEIYYCFEKRKKKEIFWAQEISVQG